MIKAKSAIIKPWVYKNCGIYTELESCVASLIIQIVLLLEMKVGIITGCGGLYELSCRNSLALVTEKGKASGARG